MHQYAPCLTLLYQALLDQGIVPLDWKKAFAGLIYKKGDHSLPENTAQYLSHVSSAKHLNILSQLISTHILILTYHQHGFRSGRLCETQLIGTINDFAEALNDSGQIDVIFLDMSKAFDTVPLKRLYAVSFFTTAFMDILLSG